MSTTLGTADFVIIGGGVIGIRLALEAKRRHPHADVVVLEKEPRCGMHASGRNSGVLHAGFYYETSSLKSRFTREGNLALQGYCKEHELRLNACGKLVVATRESDLAGLDELARRGRAAGVPLEEIGVEDAHEIEPRARVFERALFSPSTATVDPGEVVDAFCEEARRSGVQILEDTAYVGCRRNEIRTSSGSISAGFVINAAGLQADRIARDFGYSQHHRILPFKGLYLYAPTKTPPFRTHIYPVPDLDKPFLGVHVTVTVDGRAKLGPTAVPAFWREHYRGLKNFDLGEFIEIVGREAQLFVFDRLGFRRLALSEIVKYHRPTLARMGERLTRGIEPRKWREWGRPGIRAQLVDVKTQRLEMDFHMEGDDRSWHVLNAVSPGFTCCIPFCAYAFDRIEEAT